jgi:hypothetical protein
MKSFLVSAPLKGSWGNFPTVPSPFTPDLDGNFTAIISVPAPNSPGAYTVKSTDKTVHTAMAIFTIIHMKGPQGEQGPTGEVYVIVCARMLEKLGFNMQPLGSKKHVPKKLQSLSSEDLDQAREVFIHDGQPRFVKYFFAGMPYGKTKLYPRKVKAASLEKLTHLMCVCGSLLQTKVYVLWKK